MEFQNIALTNIPIYATDNRWADILYILQAEGIKLSDIDKSVLLCEFAYYDNKQVVDYLLRHKANPNFYFFSENSSFAYKLRAYPGTTPIGQSILGAHERHHNTLPILKLLLDYGADINMHTYSGYTPLQLAIVMDCQDHACLLLERGADPYKFSTDMDAPDAFYFSENHDWAVTLLEKWKIKRGA